MKGPPGNVSAVSHGAYSPAVIDLRAEQLVAGLRASPNCPPHLQEPLYLHSLMAWARAEARVERLSMYADALEVEAGLTEASEVVEELTTRKGGSTRRTTGRRMEPVQAALERWERRAQSLRNDLLITPAAAARARVDMRPKFDLAAEIAQLEETSTDGR
jgi:hypothetical protein